jgi:ABC-type antimicrobial peptide transport system permease subunit
VGALTTWLVHPAVNQLLLDAGIDPASPSQALVMNTAQAAALAAVAMLAATLVASWLPARRAASIEPMEALRAE